MKGQHTLIFLLIFAIAVGVCTWIVLRTRKEGFQSQARGDILPKINTPEDTVKEFWSIVNAANDHNTTEYIGTLEMIKRVSDPFPGDPFQVSFPKYISAYALAKYKRESVPARNDLLNNYDTNLRELTTLVYDQTRIAEWNTDPKTQSCVAIDIVKNNFAASLASLRLKMQELEGNVDTLAKMRDENLQFQKQYLSVCSTTPPSQACVDLASQEPILFPLLAIFGKLNTNIFTTEIEIQENINVLNDTFKLLKCSGGDVSVDIEKDVGTVDTLLLQEKLQILSPYYISPDTLRYVTNILITPEQVDESRLTNTTIYNDTNNTIKTIKTVTGTPL